MDPGEICLVPWRVGMLKTLLGPPTTGVTITYKYVVVRWERQRSGKRGRTEDSEVVGNSLM